MISMINIKTVYNLISTHKHLKSSERDLPTLESHKDKTSLFLTLYLLYPLHIYPSHIYISVFIIIVIFNEQCQGLSFIAKTVMPCFLFAFDFAPLFTFLQHFLLGAICFISYYNFNLSYFEFKQQTLFLA